MTTLLALLLQAASAQSPSMADADITTMTSLRILPSSHCVAEGDSDVVVCGQRRGRYRLPLPVERTDAPHGTVGASGMAGLTGSAPCGIFAGQRRCSKEEALQYGYGGGRNPIAVATRLARKVAGADD